MRLIEDVEELRELSSQDLVMDQKHDIWEVLRLLIFLDSGAGEGDEYLPVAVILDFDIFAEAVGLLSPDEDEDE